MKERLFLAYFPGGNVPSLYASTPTHLTLVGWFEIDKDQIPALIDALRFIFRQFGDVRAIAGEEAMFGEHEDVPVSIIEPGSPLPVLHLGLMQAIEEMGGTLADLKWSGFDYQPHISRKPDSSFSFGDEFVIRSAHLIRSVSEEPKRREVVESFRW